MAERALYSVIIPSFNRATVLPDALESVLAQGVDDVQVIVIDDGSTDETRDVVAAYEGRVQYLFQDNQGPGAARNMGVEAARGEWIGFLDSDDVWLPGKIERELEYFQKFTEAEALVSDCELWSEGKLLVPSMLRRKLGGKGSHLSFERPELMPADPLVWTQSKNFGTSCMTIKRTALLKLGEQPFDSSLRVFEDFDFEVRLLRACRVLIVPETLVRMRRFDDGTRLDRAAPGHPPTPEQARLASRRRYDVMDKVLRLGGWPKDVIEQLVKIKHEIASEMDSHSNFSRAAVMPQPDILRAHPRSLSQFLLQARRRRREARELTVVVGVRARTDEPERLRNAEACLLALNRQNLERSRYGIVVVEQDQSPQHEAVLAPLADHYIFAYNPGLYNRGWAFNMGAALADQQTGTLFLADADLLLPPDFLRRGLTSIRSGQSAVLPYSEIAYLDAEATERAIRDRLLAPMRPWNVFDYGGKLHSDSRGGCIWATADLYHRIGGHDERFRGWGGEDRDFWRRLEEATTIEIWPDRLLHLNHRKATRANPVGIIMPPAQNKRLGDPDLYAAEEEG